MAHDEVDKFFLECCLSLDQKVAKGRQSTYVYEYIVSFFYSQGLFLTGGS